MQISERFFLSDKNKYSKSTSYHFTLEPKVAMNQQNEKEVKNLRIDAQKNKDLEFLKNLGGPFTNVDELNMYMSNRCVE